MNKRDRKAAAAQAPAPPWPEEGSYHPLNTPRGLMIYKVFKANRERVTMLPASEAEVKECIQELQQARATKALAEAVTVTWAVIGWAAEQHTAEVEKAEAERSALFAQPPQRSMLNRLLGRR